MYLLSVIKVLMFSCSIWRELNDWFIFLCISKIYLLISSVISRLDMNLADIMASEIFARVDNDFLRYWYYMTLFSVSCNVTFFSNATLALILFFSRDYFLCSFRICSEYYWTFKSIHCLTSDFLVGSGLVWWPEVILKP